MYLDLTSALNTFITKRREYVLASAPLCSAPLHAAKSSKGYLPIYRLVLVRRLGVRDPLDLDSFADDAYRVYRSICRDDRCVEAVAIFDPLLVGPRLAKWIPMLVAFRRDLDALRDAQRIEVVRVIDVRGVRIEKLSDSLYMQVGSYGYDSDGDDLDRLYTPSTDVVEYIKDRYRDVEVVDTSLPIYNEYLADGDGALCIVVGLPIACSDCRRYIHIPHVYRKVFEKIRSRLAEKVRASSVRIIIATPMELDISKLDIETKFFEIYSFAHRVGAIDKVIRVSVYGKKKRVCVSMGFGYPRGLRPNITIAARNSAIAI